MLPEPFAETRRINRKLADDAGMRESQFILSEISRFRASKQYRDMLTGKRYYTGKHDILARRRTIIGESGVLEEVSNLPNNRIVDNQYKKMVTQKVNYLLGQPIVFKSDNEEYAKHLKRIFNKRFMRLMKNVGYDCFNCGIGWVFISYDEAGGLCFRRINPSELLPFWSDEEHTRLDMAVRFYETEEYRGRDLKRVERIELYKPDGLYRYIHKNGRLEPDNDEGAYEPYLALSDGKQETPLSWLRIPLVPFKYNSEELPLINSVKSLQDGMNLILSNFQNNMEEDPRNSIMVLVNYDGENLPDFRKKLAAYGAVKVKTHDGHPGDVRVLRVEVNCENYKAILELFKKAIMENAMGYDAKDDSLAGNPNQMNIQSMYSDIDLDANEVETEFQASFEELLWFIDAHLGNTEQGDFELEEVEVIFNRDMLISEGEIIENIQKSVGILSDETLIANHPWVDDVQAELERIRAGKEVKSQENRNRSAPQTPQDETGGVEVGAGEEAGET